MKKLISKIETTLSVFFNTPVKLKESKEGNGDKIVFFNKKETDITYTAQELKYFISVDPVSKNGDYSSMNVFIKDSLGRLVKYK